MPVLAKQNISLEHQLYDYHYHRRAAEFAVYDSAFTTSIQQRLLLFRSHHQKCASRRRHALANEMKQESQRADWLKRKYLDSVRQQQPSHQQQTPMTSTCSRVPVTSVTSITSTTGSSGEDSGGATTTTVGTEQSGVLDLKPAPAGSSVPASGRLSVCQPPGVSQDTDVAAGQASVLVKCKPEPQEYLQPASPSLESQDITIVDRHAPLQQVPEPTSLGQEVEPKRRQSIKADHFKWVNLTVGSSVMDVDARDDLKLTAYDVIAGVISTPPIKPLEPEAEGATAKMKPLPGRSSTSPTTTTTPHQASSTPHLVTTTATLLTSSTPHQASSSVHQTNTISPSSTVLPNSSETSPSKVSKEQQDLDHELDQFSKIMDEVTQQQTAMEMAFMTDQHLYPVVSQALPREAPANGPSFYQQPQQQQQQQQAHSSSPSSSQVADQKTHQCSIDSKPSMVLLRGSAPGKLTLVNDVAAPLGNSTLPRTPVTPLEHFSSFPSPLPSRIMSSTATTHHTPHHAPNPGTPQHPSTPHLLSHPTTPHHPGTPHHPLHPSSTPLPHPTTPYHSTPHVPCSPYHATPPLPYRYEPEPNGLRCSAAEGWPVTATPPHDQVATAAPLDQMTTPPFPRDSPAAVSQGSLRDSILARVSSRVVALAGRKRPPTQLDLSGASAAKMKATGGAVQEPCHGRPPLYSPITQHLPSHYQSGPLTGSPFTPRQL